MKKFTIITKDGSKWLRPVNPFDENGQAWRGFQSSNPDLPYIGSRPEGTTLDESEVSEVRQRKRTDRTNADWQDMFDGIAPLPIDYHETRIAYTDAESHDRHISDDYPGVDYQPLFNHMSKVHGLTLTTSEMDEIIGLSTYILAKK